MTEPLSEEALAFIAAYGREEYDAWCRTHVLRGNIWFDIRPVTLREDQIVELPE